MFLEKKAGLFTKFVDTFVFLFVGKRASWYMMQSKNE